MAAAPGPTSTPERIVLLGAGGHARVALEALLDTGRVVVGAITSDGRMIDQLGIELLGRDDDLTRSASDHKIHAAFVAIGDNGVRARVAARWGEETGLGFARAISRHAMVSTTAEIAGGVLLAPGSVVNAATTIDQGAIVNTNASVDHDCAIGAYAHVAPGVAIAGGVTVGDRCFVGIGARILPGLTVGDGATIGGGAVVIADVPAGATVVGVPARQVTRP